VEERGENYVLVMLEEKLDEICELPAVLG